jgi:hypothetical protein
MVGLGVLLILGGIMEKIRYSELLHPPKVVEVLLPDKVMVVTVGQVVVPASMVLAGLVILHQQVHHRVILEALGIIPTLMWAHLVVVAQEGLASSRIIFPMVVMVVLD